MTKKLIARLLLLAILSISLYSCRTEEATEITQEIQKKKIVFFQRFEKEKSFSKNSSNNYAIPFAQCIEAYFQNHPEKKVEIENKYGSIDLKVSSQDIGRDEDDGRKLLFFPILKDGNVTAVIAGVVNAERDYLYFDIYTNTHPDVFYLRDKFQQYYNTQTVSKGSNDPHDIAEVIIIVTRPVKLSQYDGWGGNGGLGNGGHDMGGGPGDYGGGNGTSTPMTMPPPPEIAIPDIKKFLSCLNITQPANLKVYAQGVFNSFPGHAFISITQGNNTMTFGFYPKNSAQYSLNGPGIFGDDSGHAYTNVWNVGTISQTQLQQIIASAISYSTTMYNIGSNNCADFALTALSYAGYNTNTSGIDSPDTVANIIKTNTGNATSGNAPQTNRTCN